MKSRDRVNYEKLESSDLNAVAGFLEAHASKLETAELTVRSSAGIYTAELRPTDEPIS
jgi:hypothetical protein